jgi:hypothetical protein
MFKYLGILGGKKQIKALGGFILIVFGITDLVLRFSIGIQSVEPTWIIWFFRGGILLGVVLLIAGLFAYDVPDHRV